MFDDIRPVSNLAKEQVGYPTQKPLALLNRIINASSNPGDVVLDPFCGCATACVSAESLGRQWIGIDLSPVAATLVEARLRNELVVRHVTIFGHGHGLQRAIIDEPQHRTPERLVMAQH